MTYGVSRDQTAGRRSGDLFEVQAILAKHRLHAFSHQAEEAVQVHRLVRLMREIAVLFALEDVEFNLEASGELSIGGLHVLTKVFGWDV